MNKYFIHEEGDENQTGPFTLAELEKKSISPDTPVWFEGISDWKLAKEVDELKSLFRNSPPPLNKKALNENHKNSKYAKKDLLVGIIAIVIILIVSVTLVTLFTTDSSDDSYYEQVLSIEEKELANPSSFLNASGTYRKNFWGDKLLLKCEFTNNATVATYKDAVVRITYYSKTNTILGKERLTVYETFKPKSSKTVELKVTNYKDVDAVGWEVISALANKGY